MKEGTFLWTLHKYQGLLWATECQQIRWNGHILNVTSLIPFFHIWLLKSFMPHSSLISSCPTSGQADKKAQALLYLALMGRSNHSRTCLHVETLSLASLFNHHKNSVTLSLFSDQVGRPALLSTENLVMWVIKLSFTLSVCSSVISLNIWARFWIKSILFMLVSLTLRNTQSMKITWEEINIWIELLQIKRLN